VNYPSYSDGTPDWMDEEEEGELGPESGYLRKLIEAINRADEEEEAEGQR
jgi:hypothetical protein